MRINVVLPSGETRSLDVGESGILVGSASGVDLALPEPGVAERHAFFHPDPSGAPTVQDLGSPAGTTVNGERITGTTALKAGDEVRIGSTLITLAPVVAPAAPPAVPTPGTPSGTRGQLAAFKNPLVLVGGGVGVAIVIVLLIVVLGGGDERAPLSPVPVPSPILPSLPPSIASPTLPSPTAVNLPPISKARVDGFYDGPKYDITFKAQCGSGPCGGSAQSGAQFQIPYTGVGGNYRGRSTIRDTCADGGVHVQAPLKVDIAFRPVDAGLIGDEWMATRIEINLRISRNAFQKKVRTSPTIITTLTCPGFHQDYDFTAVLTA
ncbi:MAG: FHA domain-containing protein [Actinomycetota bacterium]